MQVQYFLPYLYCVNNEKGYGFIISDNGNEYFLHYTGIDFTKWCDAEGNSIKLEEDDPVLFDVKENEKGELYAFNVNYAGDLLLPHYGILFEYDDTGVVGSIKEDKNNNLFKAIFLEKKPDIGDRVRFYIKEESAIATHIENLSLK